MALYSVKPKIEKPKTAQDRWIDKIEKLGTDLIDLDCYPPDNERLTMWIANKGICPDWAYEHEILFMCQLNWA